MTQQLPTTLTNYICCFKCWKHKGCKCLMLSERDRQSGPHSNHNTEGEEWREDSYTFNAHFFPCLLLRLLVLKQRLLRILLELYPTDKQKMFLLENGACGKYKHTNKPPPYQQTSCDYLICACTRLSEPATPSPTSFITNTHTHTHTYTQ